jgi:2-desacetyl-2-hydroxyethyl bacteriochlorophyllide A dehydrogenase
VRRAVSTSVGRLAVEETLVPAAGSGEVVIRVEACGICGTDRSLFAGDTPFVFPAVQGHEFSGTVVDLGADVCSLKVGDRVAVDPNVVCLTCAACRRGQSHLCVNLSPLGISRSGGFAEFAAVPERNAYAMPPQMSFEEGALLEPLACCIRGIQMAGIQLGDTVGILGAGPVGSLLMQLASLQGAARVYVGEPDANRRKRAKERGPDLTVETTAELTESLHEVTGGMGADVVIDATGRTTAAEAALSMVRRGGTVVWFGCCPEREQVSVSPYWVNDAEISIRGSFNNPHVHSRALALVAAGKVDVAGLVTHRLGLADLADALGSAGPAGAMKVVVCPSLG